MRQPACGRSSSTIGPPGSARPRPIELDRPGRAGDAIEVVAGQRLALVGPPERRRRRADHRQLRRPPSRHQASMLRWLWPWMTSSAPCRDSTRLQRGRILETARGLAWPGSGGWWMSTRRKTSASRRAARASRARRASCASPTRPQAIERRRRHGRVDADQRHAAQHAHERKSRRRCRRACRALARRTPCRRAQRARAGIAAAARE